MLSERPFQHCCGQKMPHFDGHELLCTEGRAKEREIFPTEDTLPPSPLRINHGCPG